MSEKGLTNQEKAALAVEVAELLTARAKGDGDQITVITIACQLLFNHLARVTFE